MSRRERRKLIRLARHDVGAEAVLASRNATAIIIQRVSASGARHDHVLEFECVQRTTRDGAAKIENLTNSISSRIHSNNITKILGTPRSQHGLEMGPKVNEIADQ
jgi:hypothetical protein